MIGVYPTVPITMGLVGQVTRIGGREIETFGRKA